MTSSPQVIMIVGGDAGIGLEVTKFALQLSKTVQVFVFGLFGAGNITYERCNFLVGDVTSEEYRKTAVSACTSMYGKIDTLIYCAGIITPIERIENLAIENLKRAFDINVFGAIAITQLCLPYLRQSRTTHPLNTGHGKILILSSACDTTVTYHGWTPYCTSKAALTRFISCLGHEEPLVSVQGVYPKLTRTKMPEDIIKGKFRGVMADHEIERFKVWDEMGDEMVEPPEWCGEAVAKLAVGLVEGGRSGETLAYDVHVPRRIAGT